MIELVVFDVAGTTVEDDGCVLAAFQSALLAHEVAATPAEIKGVMGLAKPVAIREMLANHRPFEPREEEVAEIHRVFVERMCLHYAGSPDVRPMRGAEATFAVLREAGVKVALDTGFSRAILDVLLQRFGWDESVLDATVASDEVERGRPDPAMIHRAMVLCGVRNPRRVAKVGDTAADMEQGRRAGAGLVVGVTSGTCTADELSLHRPSLILADVGALPAVLRERSKLATNRRRVETDLRDKRNSNVTGS